MAQVMTGRFRRSEPAAIHILASEPVLKPAAELLITSYIDAAEALWEEAAEAACAVDADGTEVDAAASALSKNENMVGQLKRIQRNLRGLPPVSRIPRPPPEFVQQQQQVEIEDYDMMGTADYEAHAGDKRNKPTNNEERKRLKKERRKNEKRVKASAAAAATQDNYDDDEDLEDLE